MGSLNCIMPQSVHRTRSSDCSVSDFQTSLAGIYLNQIPYTAGTVSTLPSPVLLSPSLRVSVDA